MAPSKIFSSHRVLGFITNHIPVCVRYAKYRNENLIVTAVGRAFHTYGSNKLRLMNVSNLHPDDITCIAAETTLVYTACQNVIRAWKRGSQLRHTYKGHNKTVHLLLPFGPLLISVDEDSVLKVWEVSTQELCLELNFDNANFCVTAVMHPHTYLNKVLVGSRQGRLQLWNINTSQLIYTFKGWNSAVTIIEQAPAIDVVAIGLSSGEIVVHNLKFDETLVKFRQDWGPVTGLSFRSDGQPILVSASTVGHLALWDLQERKLANQMRNAHAGSVTGLRFLPNEPLMVTTSPDNSLKIWIFDQPDGTARLLRIRQGHSAPPSRIRFYGNDGRNVLSAGQDSTLKMFSTVTDMLNKNLGTAAFYQKAYKKNHDESLKMPPIVDFTSEPTREREWDNIVTCHRGQGLVPTWSSHLGKLGQHKLKHERFHFEQSLKKAAAMCVALTSCGNFVVIGYDSGHVDCYNVQSGIFRGAYGDPKAHESGVNGVATDGLVQLTITGSSDCCLKFWRFKAKNLLEAVTFEFCISQILLHRESGLLAVVLDDFTVRLVDIDTRRVVRIFSGPTGRIADVCFSPDSRWLLAASMDCTVRTWDIPSASMVDCFLVDIPCTSLTMSPTADYLATTHVEQLGIYLWCNQTLYSHVSLHRLPDDYEPLPMSLPTSGICANSEKDDKNMDEDEVNEEFQSPAQISEELVTLSLLPHSRWHNLLMLDVIKERNKPKQPPKKPKAAPFFLPTVPGLAFQFDLSSLAENANTTSRVANVSHGLFDLSDFCRSLDQASHAEDCTDIIEKMKEMSPSAIDVELRRLSPDFGGSKHLMMQFLRFISFVLESNRDFEAAQAYLGLFVKLHWDTISQEPEVLEFAQKTAEIQKTSWERVQKEFHQCLCLVNFLKNAAL